MPRYRIVNGEKIQFTAEEETLRDAEEKAWAEGELDRNLSQLRETNAINFEKDYSLSEFKKILETYNDLKEYPDIDKK